MTSRTRRALGKTLEANSDLKLALAHLGADPSQAPPQLDLKAWRDSAAAAASAPAVVSICSAESLTAFTAQLAAAKARAARAAAEIFRQGFEVTEEDEAEMLPMLPTPCAAAEAEAASIEASSAAVAIGAASAGWWACGVLLEFGVLLEATAQPEEALRHYECALGWRPQSAAASCNVIRLSELVGVDLLGAAAACVSLARSATLSREYAAGHALAAARAEGDGNEHTQAVVALQESGASSGCVYSELEEMLRLLRTGFAQRSLDEGPPSEIPVSKQRDKLAVAMEVERRRSERLDGESAGASDPSGAVADRVRLKREAGVTATSRLEAVMFKPGRLFDTKDAAITSMLWGVEKASQRLQAAMARGGAAASSAASGAPGADEGGGAAGARRGSLGAHPRPSTAHADLRPATEVEAPITPREREAAVREKLATARREHLAALGVDLMSWRGGADDADIHTPVADRLVAAAQHLRL